MAADAATFNEAAKYLIEILKAQPDLVKTGSTGMAGGKQAGEFISALHAEISALLEKRPK